MLRFFAFIGVFSVLTAVGASINWFALIGYDPGSAVLKAAAEGRSDLVRQYVTSGVDINLPDETGETALMKAAKNGHLAVVKVLLLNGARADLQDPFGETALTLAQAKGHTEIIELLRKAGAGY